MIFFFRLNFCELTQKSCDVIGSALSSDCSRLKELELSGNNLKNIQPLCVGLKSQHCKLETLRFRLLAFTFIDSSCITVVCALGL